MKDKDQIVGNWLPRYTGVPLDQFGEHVLLTNFGGYLHTFARLTGAEVVGLDRPMPSATSDGIT
ncbi:MAG: AMP nucleosidase, partial [Lysobacter sp.]